MIRLIKGTIVREVSGMDAAAPFLAQGFTVDYPTAPMSEEEAAARKKLAKLKPEELRAECERLHIEAPKKATKADMIDLLVAAAPPPPEA